MRLTTGQKQLVKGLNALGITTDTIMKMEQEMVEADQKAKHIQNES